MIDQNFDRDFQHSRLAMYSSFATAAAHLLRQSLQSFEVLNRIEYSAPWQTKQKKAAS